MTHPEPLPDTGEPLTDAELLDDDDPIETFMDPSEAIVDPTVDDTETEQPPHADLPPGARAEDYAAEEQDGEEETPSPRRGQRDG
jgi:hypothetical protein